MGSSFLIRDQAQAPCIGNVGVSSHQITRKSLSCVLDIPQVTLLVSSFTQWSPFQGPEQGWEEDLGPGPTAIQGSQASPRKQWICGFRGQQWIPHRKNSSSEGDMGPPLSKRQAGLQEQLGLQTLLPEQEPHATAGESRGHPTHPGLLATWRSLLPGAFWAKGPCWVKAADILFCLGPCSTPPPLRGCCETVLGQQSAGL